MCEPSLSPILIAGPTASGKSGLATVLAERLGGVVVNADSMQVYRELRILTARPSSEDEARVPHDLYGFVQAEQAYSVGLFVADAAKAIAHAQAQGLRPILVGGTGLYFKALLEGLSAIPAIAPDVREHWRQTAGRIGAAGLHQMLAVRDPLMAGRLRPTDTQRLTRALEVIDGTGRSLADWQQQRDPPLLDAQRTPRLLVELDREDLYRRAEARFDRMIKDGALDEVRALADLALDASLPAMRAIGVRPLIATLNDEMSLDAALVAAKAETRHYIKRQQTWLKGNMISWIQFSKQQMESKGGDILALIRGFG